ncbi:MAG: LacI family transcriptional regulator [Bacteroidia bacterium]|nr:LacI family transcriptional regulator [Bacteroidia bacterium]MBT8268603.1 LacI family transcriptional regulator [Bacteroidia bacterium]NNF81643.1 LacI family DNA-binding transcriptional regulator [Flavobacteriaceae bacterium]NNK71210.1 LacI family DNA-binding transcriptional regulator [Flavobacteriaceae bacterium]NNL79811.1 LacI family DNA-binding transcriptional regulator [Flavobacteriaceae bacterium]
MRKTVTLKQIARELDVSVSTVSKALRDSAEISDDTKEKVQAFAKLYNYKPNNIALSLKNRKTKTIGVIIPEIVHYFFSKVIYGIENKALEKGYNVIIGLSNESFDNEVINMETLANGSIDGFILSLSKETLLKQDFHHLNETINQGMPLVLFDRASDKVDCDKVIIDDAHAAQTAVQKLLDCGCRSIALITTEDHVSVGQMRTQGYCAKLVSEGFEIDDQVILKIEDPKDSEERLELLEKTIEDLLHLKPDIDGILAVNELYAVTAMKIARKLDLKIPDDIQIIGFTDGVLSRHSTPSLSTICQNAEMMGERAAEMLIDRIEQEDDEPVYETVIVPINLIERESTKS